MRSLPLLSLLLTCLRLLKVSLCMDSITVPTEKQTYLTLNLMCLTTLGKTLMQFLGELPLNQGQVCAWLLAQFQQ